MEISWVRLRRTPHDYAAADLVISVDSNAIKYNVYLRNAIELQFKSSERGRAEFAVGLLRRAGVSAEVRKEVGRDRWYIKATTDRLAARCEELRRTLAEIVRTARENRWIDVSKAERWLKKLGGRTLGEGWPKYKVRLVEGVPVVIYCSVNPDGIKRKARRLRDIGLEESRYFSVPGGSGRGCISIRKEGLACVARPSSRTTHSREPRKRTRRYTKKPERS